MAGRLIIGLKIKGWLEDQGLAGKSRIAFNTNYWLENKGLVVRSMICLMIKIMIDWMIVRLEALGLIGIGWEINGLVGRSSIG